MPTPQVRKFSFVLAVGMLISPAAAAAQAVPTQPARETLNRVGADLFSATPHPAEAIKELKSLLAAEPGVAEAHMLLGIAYRAQASPDVLGEAVAELRQALALNPSLVLARLTLARVYLDMARTTRAREELNIALEQVPGNPQILALLGETERRLGNPRRSLELNREALKADATFPQARYYLSLALLDLRQPAAAIRELQQVVKSGANAAEAQLALGTAYVEAGRLDDALTALREAARLDPSRPEPRIQLARIYRTKGLLDQAARELALAKPSGPAGLSALYHSVESDLHLEEGLLRLQQGKLEAAAESFQRVLDLDPANATAKRQLAEVRRRMKETAGKKSPGERS